MNGFAKVLIAAFLFCSLASAKHPAVIESVKADQDSPLTLDPAAPFWRSARPILLDRNKLGKRESSYRAEVRTRWTENNLYFLFECPFAELFLKPNPSVEQETYELWNWDVAEVFIGSDFDHINRYKEFEVSPQGEWVD